MPLAKRCMHLQSEGFIQESAIKDQGPAFEVCKSWQHVGRQARTLQGQADWQGQPGSSDQGGMIWAMQNQGRINADWCALRGQSQGEGRQVGGGFSASLVRAQSSVPPQNLSASGPLRGHTRFLRNM